MKKLCAILCSFLILICFFAVGCSTENSLYNAVSELRSDLYQGSNENLTIKACYGFKETPYQNDASVGEKVYSLSFRLLDRETNVTTYSISFEFDGKTFKEVFKLNPVTDAVTAVFEIDNFNLKEFPVTISYAGDNQTITLKSIVPDGTINYKTALDYLKKNQSELISAHTDKDGFFNAEIYARVVVKDQKSYWYIGIASGGGNLKALLIDGVSGETLAIREIF